MFAGMVGQRKGRLIVGKAIFVCGLVLSTCAAAMDITLSEVEPRTLGLALEGRIEPGDYEKLLSLLARSRDEVALNSVPYRLNSEGGNVGEALKIARLLRDGFHSVFVNEGDTCASSCFLIWLAGTWRVNSGRLGVHRPTFEASYFLGLPPQAAAAKLETLQRDFRAHLDVAGLPVAIQDRIFATPSTEIHWLSDAEIMLIGRRPMWYEEILAARCGITRKLDDRDAKSQGTSEDYLRRAECALSIQRSHKAHFTHSELRRISR